jgi:2'-5' RNA ligase
MKTNMEVAPGYRVFEYLLVVNMPEDLRNRVLKLREEFAEKYKVQNILVKPQLLLASFRQYAMMEERILNKLRTLAMGFPPFRVALKDFGSFPSHTIYINVGSKIPIQNLVRSVRTEIQRLTRYDEEHKPHFILEPFVAVGLKLKPWQYEKGWLEYSHCHFAGRFIAESMSLLKRSPGELKYKLVEGLEFRNMPVRTKQGALFG